ncbi:MAG TPA: efflux RND transporter periplasmic adaptor subunit [Lacipirellulaceae bacterium]|nr:efflux RND transporter periplasmic adaptor subunit [Lacipirellulaceae bacterium]
MRRLSRVIVFVAIAILMAGGLTLLLLVLAGVFKSKVDTSRPPITAESSVPSDATAEVGVVRRPRFETAVGSVEPVHEAAVASKLLARVVEVKVRAGQAVTEDDVLVRLDDAELRTRLNQAESAVRSAESRHDRAKADYARAETLVAARVVTRAEFDQITDELKTSEAELQRAQQAADEARVLLGYATIHSPLTGVVIDKRVEAGDTVSPGQVLVTLYEPNRMQLVATVRESLAEHLKVGDEIRARLDALGHECSATVREIVPQAETASRSFTVKVTGPCPPGVYSGMFGRIFIPLSEEEVLIVPRDAVSHVGQLSLVDVVEGNSVRRRSVQLGRELPEGYEVLSGLRAGEKVVVRPAKTPEGRS